MGFLYIFSTASSGLLRFNILYCHVGSLISQILPPLWFCFSRI